MIFAAGCLMAQGFVPPGHLPISAASPRTTRLLASVTPYDPFSDPVFNLPPSDITAHASQADAAPAVSSTLGTSDLVFMFVFYAVFMYGLEWWDEKILPELQEKGIMPRIPGEPVKLTKEDRALPYLTPTTADHAVPLPAYTALADACHRIGVTGNNVAQYICTQDNRDESNKDFSDSFGECIISDEFTDFYGDATLICKRKVA